MNVLRKTKSVCPVCLKTIDAELVRSESEVLLRKRCPDHGNFSAPVWRHTPSFETWGIETSHSQEDLQGKDNNCPHACGLCAEHKQRSCTVLLELTQACNLRCPVCFANSGKKGVQLDDCGDFEDNSLTTSEHHLGIANKPPLNDTSHTCNESFQLDFYPSDFLPLDRVTEQLITIRKKAGDVVLQLSGGEPTLHPDIVKIVEIASKLFSAVQLNTNGLLLAEDIGLVHALKEAGLSWVFLQFDGVSDDVFLSIRGRKLLEIKKGVIENCQYAGLSVILVPVVVSGINEHMLGDIVRFALSSFPTVRGVHFQPMTLSGRNFFQDKGLPHVTLPEVLTKLSEQSNGMIAIEHAQAPSCEHSLCSFSCRYYVTETGSLQYIREQKACGCVETTSKKTVFSNARDEDAVSRSIEATIRAWKAGTVEKQVYEQELERQSHQSFPTLASDLHHSDLYKNLGKNEDFGGSRNDVDSSSIHEGESNSSSFFVSFDSLSSLDAFDTFLERAKRQIFSVSCMAFQDVHTLDLDRLQGCCVHVFDGKEKLIPFCAYNLTALDGTSLYR